MKLCQFLGLGKTSKPKIMPPMAPRLQKNSECHSSFTFFLKQKVMIDMIIEEHAGSRKTLTFIQRIVNDAADMPDERPFHAM